MEDDCGRQFENTEGKGIHNSNQSPDDVQKTPISQALEKEITELKRTVAAHEIDMLRIMADNNSKNFRLNTGARNLKCLFKKCCSLRRKIHRLNEQIVKLKNMKTKMKNKTQNPLHEPEPLAVIPLKSHALDFQYVDVHIRETGYQETKQTRSMVKRIKMKDRKVQKDPDFQYTELGKKAKRSYRIKVGNGGIPGPSGGGMAPFLKAVVAAVDD
ncbi:hypothetical protein QJS10_CPB15g01159 [Acorus calamus]|uniref:Uncharacterized protein n=1 Tax=Acorus calamus TaxID=4465 RepID=A0AAV9D6X2_ACOCL|nr:hypothetical protein QJS10_CPB15g01159 [Acorus calamus]